MPTVYRIEFGEGAAESGMDAALGAAVDSDGRSTGRVVAGEYQALLIGDEIRLLPHPLESSTLRAQKQTYLSASLRGMLLRVERRICLRCGHVFDAPRLVFAAAAGCWPVLVASFLAFPLARFGLAMSTSVSLLTASGVLMAVVALVHGAGALYVRVRFSDRQASVAQRRCQACGGGDSVSVTSIAGKRVRIGDKGRWVEVSVAGRS